MNDWTDITRSAPSAADPRPILALRIPAEAGQTLLVRAAISGVIARFDPTVEALEDLKLAVNEACAMSIELARPGTDLVLTVAVNDDRMAVSVVSEAARAEPPSRTSFGWIVLSALVDEASAHYSDGELEVRLITSVGARSSDPGSAEAGPADAERADARRPGQADI